MKQKKEVAKTRQVSLTCAGEALRSAYPGINIVAHC
jgi:hypothetical protein